MYSVVYKISRHHVTHKYTYDIHTQKDKLFITIQWIFLLKSESFFKLTCRRYALAPCRLLINVMYVLFFRKNSSVTRIGLMYDAPFIAITSHLVSCVCLCVCVRANQVYIRSERGVQSQCVQQQRTSVMRVFYMMYLHFIPIDYTNKCSNNEEATQLNVLPFYFLYVCDLFNLYRISHPFCLLFIWVLSVDFGKVMFVCVCQSWMRYFFKVWLECFSVL